MKITGKTKVIGVFGYPVEHSMSPVMHNRAFEVLESDHVYVPLEVEPGNLEKAVEGIRTMGFLGANVTIPHKEAVLPLMDEISPESEKIGAVNTIINRHGHLIGTSTDGVGFIKGFEDQGGTITGQKVAILGTGGAARSIAFTLAMQNQASSITLVGRNESRLEEIRTEVERKTGVSLEILNLREINKHSENFDLWVQTTSLGMYPHMDKSVLEASCLHPHQTVYDIVYNPEDTLLIRMAQEKGLKTAGGLGMLVHQGLASLEMWTGLKPDPGIFYDSIRKTLYS